MAKRKNNRIVLFSLLGLVVVLAVVAALNGGKKKTGEKVFTEKVTKRSIVETVGASGRIYPEIEVKITSDVSGEIVQLSVQEGDSVTAGQLLARIRPEQYVSALERSEAAVNTTKAQLANSRSQIEQTKAQLLQIEAQLDNARAVHQRNTKLFSDGVIAQAELDASLAQLKANEANRTSALASLESAKQAAKAAEFNVASAEASVKEAKDNLARTSIYAPQSGIISQMNVELGERIVGNQMMSGTELMRIANLRYMEVRVDVSENDVLRVAMGNEVKIEVDAYLDRIFTGKVTEIANSATAGATGTLSTDQVTNFTVKIRIDPNAYRDLVTANNRFAFRPGMSASVEIKTGETENILAVPIQAVATREATSDKAKTTAPAEEEVNEVVFIYAADTVKMAKVKTGIQDDEYIQIVEGLAENEEIVTGPYNAVARKLKGGDKVKKTDKNEAYNKSKKAKPTDEDSE